MYGVSLCWFPLRYLETELLTKPTPHCLGWADWPASSHAPPVFTPPTQCWGYGYVWPCLPGFFHEHGTQALNLAQQALLPTEPFLPGPFNIFGRLITQKDVETA